MRAFDEGDFKSEKCKFCLWPNYTIFQWLVYKTKPNAVLSVLDVKELVQECVGGAALQQCKSKVQSYSEQTATTLKKHVYANYMQFIETAKEISRMFHYSHYVQFIWAEIWICGFCSRPGIWNVSIITLVDWTTEYFVDTAWAKFNRRYKRRIIKWTRKR